MGLNSNGQLLRYLEHVSEHIMNICLSRDDIWDNSYEEATRIVTSRAHDFRKAAVKKGDWE